MRIAKLFFIIITAATLAGNASAELTPLHWAAHNPAVAVVHNSRTIIIFNVFARPGADPQGDSIIRARFCPECRSTHQKQKARPVHRKPT